MTPTGRETIQLKMQINLKIMRTIKIEIISIMLTRITRIAKMKISKIIATII